MASTKRVVASVLLSCVALALGLLFLLRQQTVDAETRRKIGTDAFTVRDSLMIYMKNHGNELPPSLNDLKYERQDVNLSAFRLLPAGSKIEQSGEDVLVQGKDPTGRKPSVYVFKSGAVVWSRFEVLSK